MIIMAVKPKKKNIRRTKRVVSTCQDCSFTEDDGRQTVRRAKRHAKKEEHLMHIWTEKTTIYDYTP